MKRKFIALSMITIFTISTIIGCGDSDAANDTNTTETPKTTAANIYEGLNLVDISKIKELWNL